MESFGLNEILQGCVWREKKIWALVGDKLAIESNFISRNTFAKILGVKSQGKWLVAWNVDKQIECYRWIEETEFKKKLKKQNKKANEKGIEFNEQAYSEDLGNHVKFEGFIKSPSKSKYFELSCFSQFFQSKSINYFYQE